MADHLIDDKAVRAAVRRQRLGPPGSPGCWAEADLPARVEAGWVQPWLSAHGGRRWSWNWDPEGPAHPRWEGTD